jgi:hypothetical protein
MSETRNQRQRIRKKNMNQRKDNVKIQHLEKWRTEQKE